jgi:hypothetical protein
MYRMVIAAPPTKNAVAIARSCTLCSLSSTAYSERITKLIERKKQTPRIIAKQFLFSNRGALLSFIASFLSNALAQSEL